MVGEFYQLLKIISRKKSVLNETRKHFRLKGFAEHITIFRNQILLSRNNLQISMQAVVL